MLYPFCDLGLWYPSSVVSLVVSLQVPVLILISVLRVIVVLLLSHWSIVIVLLLVLKKGAWLEVGIPISVL